MECIVGSFGKTLEGLRELGFTAGNAVVSAVRIDDCDNVVVVIDAYGVVSTAWVEMVDVASTNVTVRATSSNPTLAPASGLEVTGNGVNRGITVRPAPGQTGAAEIIQTGGMAVL